MTELISKNIRNQRLAKNMTQEELAAKIYTTRQTVSNYETGKSKPDYETIGEIAAALGVSAETLLYDTNDSRKKIQTWCSLFATVFVFLLALAILKSSLLFNGTDSSLHLAYSHGYTTVIIPAVCTFFGWILVRLYELYIQKDKLHINHSKTLSVILTLFLIVWFIAALIDLPLVYNAASDTVKNQYGGPLALSLYIETFYYKFIYRIIFQLPILHSLFIIIGGLTAVCFNKENADCS